MEIPAIYIFTHDSIGVGEDGPTHQPVEQLASLRAMPGPDHDPARRRQRGGRGVARASCSCSHEPVALVLTRQALPTLDRSRVRAGRRPGAGRLRAGRRRRTASPSVILIGTGSEVPLCVDAYEQLTAEGVQGARRQHAVVGAVRAASRRSTATQVLPPAVTRARLGRAGLDLRLGALRRDRRERSSACTPSAPRRRSRTCSRSSASRPRRWPRSAAGN